MGDFSLQIPNSQGNTNLQIFRSEVKKPNTLDHVGYRFLTESTRMGQQNSLVQQRNASILCFGMCFWHEVDEVFSLNPKPSEFLETKNHRRLQVSCWCSWLFLAI